MTIRVFMSGQSNALGAGTGGPDWAGVSPSVRVWNNKNPVTSVGDSFVMAAQAKAVGVFFYTDRGNFGPWFCDKLARTQFDTVDLTAVIRSASNIGYWAPEGAAVPMLQQCIDVWAATGQEPADVFLWHQGESNTSTGHEAYREAFEALLANLTAGGVIGPNTLVLIGGLAETTVAKHRFNLGALRELANRPGRAYASSYRLPNYDGTHFTGDALAEFGASRYYAAYQFARATMRTP